MNSCSDSVRSPNTHKTISFHAQERENEKASHHRYLCILNSINIITNSVSICTTSTIELTVQVYNNTQQNDKRKSLFGKLIENDWNLVVTTNDQEDGKTWELKQKIGADGQLRDLVGTRKVYYDRHAKKPKCPKSQF